jgi:hypothetical protein
MHDAGMLRHGLGFDDECAAARYLSDPRSGLGVCSGLRVVCRRL